MTKLKCEKEAQLSDSGGLTEMQSELAEMALERPKKKPKKTVESGKEHRKQQQHRIQEYQLKMGRIRKTCAQC